MTYPEHAERLWSILTEFSKSREVQTYTGIGGRLGLKAQSVSGVLAPIHAYCEQNDLPLLTALVVQKKTRRPGTGFKSINDYERVFARDWTKVATPTATDLASAAKRSEAQG